MAIAMDGRNVHLVAIQGDGVVILAPRLKMTRAEAINLAAYLVALSDGEDDFIETLSHLEDDGLVRTKILDPPPDPEAA